MALDLVNYFLNFFIVYNQATSQFDERDTIRTPNSRASRSHPTNLNNPTIITTKEVITTITNLNEPNNPTPSAVQSQSRSQSLSPLRGKIKNKNNRS
jgi:hypothetical protein